MSRGRLRVFLGAAPGVGKTCAMLDEGHNLVREGHDVVIALLETHGRSQTAQLSLIHISEPTRPSHISRMPSSA